MAFAFRRFAVGIVLLLLSLHVSISEAQSALNLSIDCGATQKYTDPATGINWVPDNPYITTGVAWNNATSQLHVPSSRHTSLRYFPEKRRKFCYVLPATFNTTYLVRTTFLYGDYDEGIHNPTFQLHIDTSNVGLINSSDRETVVEVIMSAVAATIYVCLAPSDLEIDVPFINSIEVRTLDPQMYPKARQGYMMFTSFRYNFGGNQDIRYPDDTYDRLWSKYPSSKAPGSRDLRSSSRVVVDNLYSRDKAPKAVMNTSLTWDPSGFALPFNVTGGRNYVVLLWFAEIDPLSQDEESREFMVGIDGKWQDPINIWKITKGNYRAYEWGYASIALSGTSTIALKANTTELGPILNAMEVYEVSDPVQPRTEMRDVAAIDAIKSYWPNLSTWAGDPCLNLPYGWTSCSVDTTRITKLELAGYNLTGVIPTAAILGLTELTVLSMANNSLNGSVPDLSSLQKLQHLHLQNNNFTGEFPAWVANLAALQELYVEGNNLTGYVPESLFNKTGLKFTYTPRGLCTGPSPTLCRALPETPSPVTPPATSPVASESSSTRSLDIIIGSVAGGFGLIILICFICLLRCKRTLLSSSVSSRHLLKADPEAAFASSTKSQTMAYSFKEVKEATNNLQDQISEGSFGPVYKGTLSDGREVAVKRCRPCNKQGATDFFDEVQFLARVHHRNLAALVGFCQDAQEQILLYEYLSNSDLRTHLHGDGKHLPWNTRLAIALDAAQGIEYLHTSCHPSIIHRDVQPRNILLTRKMTAKVVDFGFAKFTGEQDPTLQVYSADVKGTAGYVDPEYTVSGHLTDKSDVYSFGVVLLELVSGQEPINKTVLNRNPLLIEWMRPLLAAEDIKAVVDPSLGDKYHVDCMWKVAELGMMCVEQRASNRPTMTEVVQELRDAIAMGATARGHARSTSITPLTSPRSDPNSGPL